MLKSYNVAARKSIPSNKQIPQKGHHDILDADKQKMQGKYWIELEKATKATAKQEDDQRTPKMRSDNKSLRANMKSLRSKKKEG